MEVTATRSFKPAIKSYAQIKISQVSQKYYDQRRDIRIVQDSIIQTTFLGAFAKLRKGTVSCVISVRPSVWNSAPTGLIFTKFGI